MSELSTEHKKNLLTLAGDETKKSNDWMTTIVVTASSFLGILIALHTDVSRTKELHYLYSTIISVIGLGILSGVVYLFSVPNTAERLRRKYVKSLDESQDGNIGDQVVATYKVFFLMKWISVLCFFVSVPLLVYYAVISDSLIN